jgi:CHAT domain-containing protein
MLIAPLGPIEGDWVIVPDGLLKDLPFAALFDGQHLVVEKRAVSYSPSANFFVAARRQDRSLGTTSSLQALVMGDPTFDNTSYRWLTPLAESEEEASRVAEQYGVAPYLQQNATKARFLAGIQGSELVHFSGHAVTHPESPQESALILADGKLTARDIQELDLARTRLVVLGACSTASGPSLGGEGAESLARAFHSAGVPGVVASLWDVSDFSTSELMIEFHRQLLSGKDARQALRQAQLRMLHSPDLRHRDPAAWAAFQLIGEATFRGSRP